MVWKRDYAEEKRTEPYFWINKKRYIRIYKDRIIIGEEDKDPLYLNKRYLSKNEMQNTAKKIMSFSLLEWKKLYTGNSMGGVF